jgi:hypothetical protein
MSPKGDLGALVDLPKEGGEVRVVLKKCGAIAGMVKGSDGKPIEGAEVIAMRRHSRGTAVFTDAVGRYKATGLLPGVEYWLRASAKGYGRYEGYVDPNSGRDLKKYLITPGVTIEAEPITLALGSATVSGRVVDATGAPVPGAWVTFYGSVSRQEAKARTDRDGRFKFEKVVREDAFIMADAGPLGSSGPTYRTKPEQFGNVEIAVKPPFDPQKTQAAGGPAPELKGVEWVQGEWKGFQAMRGKRVAIAFVSIKNRACRKVIADLQTERNQVSARNLVSAGAQVVLVHDASATAEEIKGYLAEKKVLSPVARVTDEKNNGWFSPAFVAYKVTSVPTIVYVGADGKIEVGGAHGNH